MQITVAGRHGHLTPEIQEQLKLKADRLLHHFSRLTAIEIIVDREGDLHSVELKLDAEHKHDIVAKETHPELMGAMDLALDKADSQLRKYKERIQEHHRR